MQKSATLEDAMALARAFERRQHVTTELSTGGGRTTSRSAQRASASSSRSTPATPTTGSTSALPVAAPKPPLPTDGHFKRLSPEEMGQCRLEGLCFNCPKKFLKEHAKVCSGKGIYY